MDFQGLADRLLAESEAWLNAWLPAGHMEGHEYCCGDIRGGPGNSLKVNTRTGAWADFADTDLSGGDLISLYARVQGIGNGDAAKRLAKEINFNLRGDTLRPRLADEPKVEIVLTPPPFDAPTPSMIHSSWDSPTEYWTYRDRDEKVLFHVARYDTAAGKQFCPWSWSKTDGQWVAKGWAAPRPLYGLDLLAASPDKPVLVVEGEKACEAARKMVGKTYVVVTWPNGSNSADKASWDALAGRTVLIWPDADRKVAKKKAQADKYGIPVGSVLPYQFQPGIHAAYQIAAALLPICKEIKIINVGNDPERTDGWDAADALAAGWTWKQFYDWAKPRATVFTGAEVPVAFAPVVVEPVVEPVPAAPEPVVTVAPAEPAPDAPAPTTQVNIQINMGEENIAPTTAHALWEDIGMSLTNGNPNINVDNVRRCLENYKPLAGILWFDEFHQKIFTNWNSKSTRPWGDVDYINLLTYIQRSVGMHKLSLDIVRQGTQAFARQVPHNEPREWMESLVWDGTSRVMDFLGDYLGAYPDEYSVAASKNFWVGMVARIFTPGCKLDNMLVLEGPQGIYKSTALEIIAGKWYMAMSESVQSKDFFVCLHGKLLVEIAEFDSFARADVTRIKQVVTTRSDSYRAPYDSVSMDHPRMSVFAATTNEKFWSRDQTGARRFWPIECRAVKLDRIAEDRDQLFAEAVHLFKAGEDWWKMPKFETEREQEARRQSDEWESEIYEFVSKMDATSILEIAKHLGFTTDRLDRGTQMRIAGIIKNLGWEKQPRNSAGTNGKVWVRTGQAKLL